MARFSKRVTRKEIRRPDSFVTLTGRVLNLSRRHKAYFIASAAVLLAVLLGLWGWDLFRGRQNRLAAQEFSRALGFYHAGSYQEALASLDQVRSYRFSRYGSLALLYQAHSYIGLQESAKAVGVLKEFIRKERREPSLRQLAFLTLAYAQERMGQCKDAAESFTAAEKISGPFKEEALLGKARCSAQNGDYKTALNAYREYLAGYPASERLGAVAVRVQELESKLGSAGASKK